MEKIICQKDEECNECGEEMPTGSFTYVDINGYLICVPCKVHEY